MILRDAASSEITSILEQTHALWSDGLEMAAYQEFIRTLMASDWARQGERSYRFMVLADGDAGPALCGMKLYRFSVRLGQRRVSAGGVGAVFTPAQSRRQGLAARMLELAHDVMRKRGDVLSLLYSEIGAAYYEKLGYRTLPLRPVGLGVPREGPERSGLRAMHRDDLPVVSRLRDAQDAAASFQVTRDEAYWRYLLARASYPTLHLGRQRWEKRIMLAPGGAGYLWSHFGEDHLGAGARLMEFAEQSPGAALGVLLDDFFAECRRRGIDRAEAWLPPGAAAPDPRLSEPLARPIVPSPTVAMWRPLGPAAQADLEAAAASPALHLTELF